MVRHLLVVLFTLASAVPAPAQSDTLPTAYLTPPAVIADILDAPPTPQALVSPDGAVIALSEQRSMPPISELAQPMHRLAGYRINPRNSAPWRSPSVVAIDLRRTSGNEAHRIVAPSGTTLGWLQFSPDSRYLSYAIVRDTGVELWVADTTTGEPRALTDASLNATWGAPCEWLPDTTGVLCRFRRSARGSPPQAPAAPAGPNIQETGGQLAPVRTYQDLLSSPHDEALFEYHFESQLATVALATGRRTPFGAPGLFERVSGAPDGEHVLVTRVTRPYSWLTPVSRFAKAVEVWRRSNGEKRELHALPLVDAVPIGGVPTGPRSHRWNPAEPATVVWVEALDGGDPDVETDRRDRIVGVPAPFGGTPDELATTAFRFRSIVWTEDGTALIEEYDRATRWTRTWLLYGVGGETRRLWDRSAEDRYRDPGSPVRRSGGGVAGALIAQDGPHILVRGRGASPRGDRPFVDRLDLTTLETERLFETADETYETLVAPLTPDGSRLLTRRESASEPPNYVVRNIATGHDEVLTDYPDPAPILRRVRKQLITYEREDGVQLSATLYLPPGHVDGDRVPMLMWAYPREYTNPAAAGQVNGSPHRFTTLRGASHLLLLTQGFAILDDPTMPIVGEGEGANDTYVAQLVTSASAAIDEVVRMGVADRNRVAIGGHSYGAFMTANLLAHSDLFRAGIARSGAYNRSLTPFGFQNERRTFWEAPEIYAAMSPFFHADKVNEPILLTHGEVDNNSGTFPIQSERFYMALKGHGATVRYVTLPHESHGYAARESVLHVVTEMLDWCNRYLGEELPRPSGSVAAR